MARKRTEGLNDMMVTFCRWYVKTYNGSLSARKAGYSENTCGEIARQLLMDPRITQYIRLLKGDIDQKLQLDAIDVMRKYAQIAMSDMTAFVEQETEWIPDIGPNGLQKMDQGYPVYKPVLVTRMRPLDEIDGALVKKIKATKTGVEIELEPREKALEKLAQHFDLFTDKAKLQIEKERLEIEKEKLALMKKASDPAAQDNTINNHNEKILTLASLLNNPQGNRSLEDYEDNDNN